MADKKADTPPITNVVNPVNPANDPKATAQERLDALTAQHKEMAARKAGQRGFDEPTH